MFCSPEYARNNPTHLILEDSSQFFSIPVFCLQFVSHRRTLKWGCSQCPARMQNIVNVAQTTIQPIVRKKRIKETITIAPSSRTIHRQQQQLNLNIPLPKIQLHQNLSQEQIIALHQTLGADNKLSPVCHNSSMPLQPLLLIMQQMMCFQ